MAQDDEHSAEGAYQKAESLIAEARRLGATVVNLTNLGSLDRIPEAIVEFDSIEKLKLTGTRISDLAPLSSLRALKEINLDSTEVSDLSPLSDLVALERLDFFDTKVSDLSPISGLGALKEIDLSGTRVSDLQPVSGLSALEELYAADVQISDLSPIARLTTLVHLNLSHTQVADLSPLSQLSNIEVLDLSDTPVQDLSPLSGLNALNDLDLSGTRVSDLSPVMNLQNLVSVGPGLSFDDCLNLPFEIRGFSALGNPMRTLKAFNFLREQQGLPPLPPEAGAHDLTMSEFIVRLLNLGSRPFSIEEIVDAFATAGYSSPRSSIRGRLNTLTQEGQIRRVARGTYASVDYQEDQPLDREEHDSYPPEVPEQGIGPTFGVTSEGRIGFTATGLTSDEDDVARIGALRDVIIAALDDLLDATGGSNAFISVRRVAQHYRAVVDGDVSAVSIDLLYAQGIRLDNTRLHLTAEIARGEEPEAGVLVGEALDSVLSLHGPLVLSTSRGQKLLELARQYNATRESDLVYKEKSIELAKAINRSGDLVEPVVGDTLTNLNTDIGEGRFPERSSDIARRSNNNFLSVVSTLALAYVGAPSFAASIPGQMVHGLGAELLNAAYVFLLTYGYELRGLAAVAGHELSWVAAFLDWLERQKKPR